MTDGGIEIVLHPPEGGERAQTWYFTFGVGDRANASRFVVMRDVSFSEARDRMYALFGRKWAFQYSADEWARDGVTQADRYKLTELEVE